ncbi:MAG: hypothetical protein CMH13_04230 [Martelella sp.]|uniref:hypothetical protein n=1 Tax=unclassified Martelella TaxID=2629616 RepID=UPI000C6A8618|nr:hypothetical protein [Martelella sp.]MAU19722.1 hypothetical protein [Martelella sp.]|tara:strand:- start:543 stop:758 length:216 start_codon:yes stop_codon:yes gene_type:complete
MEGRKSGFDPHGRHLVASKWVTAEAAFRSEPARGDAHDVGATSVGIMAIHRFQRPVSYQNLPDALMPAGWQ